MSSAAADAPAEAPLNAYEMERAERIKRNKQVMAALGLFDEHVAFAAQMRNGGAAPAADDGRQRPGKAKGRKRAATDAPADVDADAATREPPRRSRRVAGLETELKGHELPSENGDGAGDVDALHEAGAWAHRQRGLRLFGTASYQHTVMRVRTMDEKALARRMTVIERAKGRHAVVKMRLFARVLFLEGYEQLAEDATAALQRLIDVLGDVASDEDEAAEEA